jgi:hypothetical protein
MKIRPTFLFALPGSWIGVAVTMVSSCGGDDTKTVVIEGGTAVAEASDDHAGHEDATSTFDVATDALGDEVADGSVGEAKTDGASEWLQGAGIIVQGGGATGKDCRTVMGCAHNSETDLISYRSVFYLVYRTALSDLPSPNSSLVIASSTDGSKFAPQAILTASVAGRDVSTPHFLATSTSLCVTAVTRLPFNAVPDANASSSTSVVSCSPDGKTWTAFVEATPANGGTTFWRPREHGGTYYTAAYQDGDVAVSLFSSTDGKSWARVAGVYDVASALPSETELVFLPSGSLLALVRLDGSDAEGATGSLRTEACWASPPAYGTFTCSEISGARLDGPVAFTSGNRVFVVARKHLQPTARKRTALYEVTGNLEGPTIGVKEWHELPSAGDTSYAGVAPLSDQTWLLSWHSGDVAKDEDWAAGRTSPTDVWRAVLDVTALH